MESSAIIIGLILIVAFIAIQIAIIRWILRINDIVFYLERINEKLAKLMEEKKLI